MRLIKNLFKQLFGKAEPIEAIEPFDNETVDDLLPPPPNGSTNWPNEGLDQGMNQTDHAEDPKPEPPKVVKKVKTTKKTTTKKTTKSGRPKKVK